MLLRIEECDCDADDARTVRETQDIGPMRIRVADA